MPDKTTPQTVPTMTAKHHFITAAIAAGIILVIALFIWIPFKLIPALFSTGSNYVATTLSSTLVPATSTPAAAQNANTSAQTTTNNSTSANTANTNTSYRAPVAPSYYGMPDLAISLIGTGIISNGQFIETPYAGANDTIGIKFAVRNIGTNVSGPWTLRLTMPSRTTPNYDSGYQQSIAPGDEMIFTASFDSPVAQGVNTGYITVDPLNLIQESNKFNNSLTVPITIEGTAYTNGYYGNSGYVNYTGNTYPVQTTPGYGTTYTWTNINATCYGNPQTIYPGGTINWFVTASGGNGYFSYNWNGTDGLYSTTNSVSHTYYTSGSKLATVAVTSNGQTITVQCNAMVY